LTFDPIITAPETFVAECGITSIDPSVAGEPTYDQECIPASDVTVTHFDVSDGLSCPETITRTWVATDLCDNVGTTTQSIEIEDTIAPEFLFFPQSPIFFPCQTVDSIDPSVAGVPIAVDNCDAIVCDITWFDSLPSTSIFDGCPGDTKVTRTWIATDTCGNSIEKTQDIIISVQETSFPCQPAPCDPEPCLLCECPLAECSCCAAGGINTCTPVPCSPVACTPVPCTTVDCIPCSTDTDNTLSPSPFCSDDVPCIPNIVPIFVDDEDGYNENTSHTSYLDGQISYWIDRASYWRNQLINGQVSVSDSGSGTQKLLGSTLVLLVVTLPLAIFSLFN